MHIIGLNDTSSTFCFFVFFGLINFIKEASNNTSSSNTNKSGSKRILKSYSSSKK